MGRIQRKIRRAGLPHRKDRHELVYPVLKAQPDHRLPAHTQGPQVMGQPIGPGMQLPIAQDLLVGDHRRAGVHTDQVVHPTRLLHHDTRVIPTGQLLLLACGQ